MNTVVISIIGGLLGLGLGLSLTFLFNKLPEKWLQDYDYDPKAKDFRPAKRMQIKPHGIFSGLFCAAFYVAAAIFFPQLWQDPKIMHLTVFILVVPVLFMVLISDKLNRIIPDEFSIFIFLCGIILLASDYVEGTIWFSEEAKWFAPLINRFGASIGAGGVLFLIGFIAETFLGKEAMGLGDVKLIAACGMCTGLYGMVILIYVAVILGVIFAIPLLIRKQKRLKAEQEYIDNSEDKLKAQLELKLKKSQIHFADDPDYLAFGPFLAMGAGVFLALEPVFLDLLSDSLRTFGLRF